MIEGVGDCYQNYEIIVHFQNEYLVVKRKTQGNIKTSPSSADVVSLATATSDTKSKHGKTPSSSNIQSLATTTGPKSQNGKMTSTSKNDVLATTVSGVPKATSEVPCLEVPRNEEERRLSEEVLATSPDLITIVETETGEPIQSSNMKYGLRVSVLVLPAPPLMTSDAALPFVGPKAFGYDGLTYNPVGDYKEYESLAK